MCAISTNSNRRGRPAQPAGRCPRDRFNHTADHDEAGSMAAMKVAASTFPYLYSHSGLDALKHLHKMGYSLFEMMIFPPHCWPRELSDADKAAVKTWLDDNGLKITSFCIPLLDNNPNGVD